MFDLRSAIAEAMRGKGTTSNAVRSIRDEYVNLQGREAVFAAGFGEAVATLAGGKDLVDVMLAEMNLSRKDLNTLGALWVRVRAELMTEDEAKAHKAEKKAQADRKKAEKNAANEGTGLALDGASGSIVISDPCLALRSCWDSALASGLTIQELLEGSGLMPTVEGFFTLTTVA